MSALIPTPSVRFPISGWTARFNDYVRLAHSSGLRLSELIERAVPAVESIESALAVTLPKELIELYSKCDGIDLGFVRILSHSQVLEHAPWVRGDVSPDDWAPCIPANVPRSNIVAFAEDGCGNFYGYDVEDKGSHRIIYLCHDPVGAELRYTSLATFIDCKLVWAYSAALHQQTETSLGRYVSDSPWASAARTLEAVIDPGVVRTIDD